MSKEVRKSLPILKDINRRTLLKITRKIDSVIIRIYTKSIGDTNLLRYIGGAVITRRLDISLRETEKEQMWERRTQNNVKTRSHHMK